MRLLPRCCHITVAAPSNTPTPSVEQVDSAAVTTNGNLTMVNEYLAGENEE